jgi:uncharacterized protein with von Willebrand factor type A (vWA) domain
MKRALITIFAVLVFVSISYGVTVFKWVDKDGVVHFTDDYTNIPAQYRNQVRTEETGESQKGETPATPSPAGSVPKSEETKVDRYGQGEDYWRSRVSPWRKQLQEATENSENISKKMNARLEEQSGKLLTPTQWNMSRAETRQWTEEKAKYDAQIKEANEMLGKIAKEAEEAKANPNWLK